MIYVIDISGFEGRDPLGDFEILRSELGSYDPALLGKPSLVVLNKIDLEGAQDHVARFKEKYPEIRSFPISASTGAGIHELIMELKENVARTGIEPATQGFSVLCSTD